MKEKRHLATAELLALVSSESTGASARAAAHEVECRICRQEVNALLALRNQPRTDADVPSDLALVRAFRLLPAKLPRLSERSRFAIPSLVYDSHTESAVAGIRAPAAARHLAWRGEEADVEVRWTDEGTAGASVLTGQVLPRGEAVGELVGDVWLEQRGVPVQWGLLDPSGEFTLPAPRGKAWRILLRWGELKMRLSP
jgi:hypothetical protein